MCIIPICVVIYLFNIVKIMLLISVLLYIEGVYDITIVAPFQYTNLDSLAVFFSFISLSPQNTEPPQIHSESIMQDSPHC